MIISNYVYVNHNKYKWLIFKDVSYVIQNM